MKRVLVVVAHPDDEVLGCGGTIPLLVKNGHQVTIAILGTGQTSRFASASDASPDLLTALQADSRVAASILGAQVLVHRQLPDNRFDSVPLLDVVKVVEQLVDEFGPDEIYTHHHGDLNVDHGVVNRAVLTATRPSPLMPVKAVYACEVASSTEWAFGAAGAGFVPNVFHDISTTLECKVAAMEAYGSEARPYPHPRSPDALRASARKWGTVAGFEAAEPFVLLRSLVSSAGQ